MTNQAAKSIMRTTANFCLFGPLTMAFTCFAQAYEALKDPDGINCRPLWAGVAGFLALTLYNWVKYFRALNRFENPECLTKAIYAGGWPIVWLPLLFLAPSSQGALPAFPWIFFCSTAATLLTALMRQLEPQIAAALAQESPEAKMAADAED